MLLGRGAERATIDALVRAACAGSSGTLLLNGQPGAGKSTMLGYAREIAIGMTVLSSQGVQGESSLPFAGLADVLRPLLSGLDRLPEVQAASLRAALALGPPLPGDRFTIYAGALSLLTASAEVSPELVLVDDLHWLDAASAEALFFASRRLSAERVAVIFAARDGVEMPADPTGLPVVTLGGLEREPSLELIGRHSPAMAAPVAEAIYQATGGNPLALVEIPALLSEGQLQGRDPLPDPLPVGVRLVSAYQARLRQLPPATQTILLLAAASEEPDLPTITRAAAVLGIDATRAVGPAEQAGLIELNGRLAFRHPLIRSAIYEGATADARRQAHRVLAESVPAEAASRQAWHRAAASVGPDEAVAGELERLGNEHQARRAYASAFVAFEHAAQLSPGVPDQVRRLTDAARSALLAGRAYRAVGQLDRALSLVTEPATHADLVLLRGQIATWFEHPMAAHASLAQEAERIQWEDPSRAALLLVHACGPCFMAGEIVEARRSATRALELAGRSGQPDTIAAARIALGEALLLHGEPSGAPLIRRAMSELTAVGPEIGNALVLQLGANCLIAAEDLETARSVLESEIRQLREASAPGLLPYPLAVMSELEFRTGRWLEAYADASESVRLARETVEDSGRSFSLVCLAWVEAAMGRDQECRAHLEEALALAERFGTGSILAHVWTIEGFHAVGLERWDTAVDRLELVRNRCRQHEMREPGVLRWNADLVEAYLRIGGRDRAIEVLAEFEKTVEATGRTWARLAALRCRAMLADAGQSESTFNEAVAVASTAGDPFELARTRLAFGEALRRSRRRGEARDHLRAALKTFQELGAIPWIRRVQRELEATGERPQRRSLPASRTLTPQELQVCRGVAQGQTNREVAVHLFLSPKTVETHLSNAYGKLGLRSRSELARLFAVEPERAAPAAVR